MFVALYTVAMSGENGVLAVSFQSGRLDGFSSRAGWDYSAILGGHQMGLLAQSFICYWSVE
jgi:hypothetical protein